MVKPLQKMPQEDMVKAYQVQKKNMDISMDMEKKVQPANQDKIYTKIKERKKAKMVKPLQKMVSEDMVTVIQNQRKDTLKKVSPVNQELIEPIKIKERRKDKMEKLLQKMP